MHHVLLGRVIDGYSDHPLDKGCVVWQDDRIVYVGPVSAYRIPEHSEILDMHGGTILPGFIDAHAHLTGEEDAGTFAGGQLFGDQLIGAVHQLKLLQSAGFTTVRDMSEAGLYLSRGVARRMLDGPDIIPGGRVLGITSGHADTGPAHDKAWINAHDPMSWLCDGPDECTLAVREQFRRGARFIKICATGGVSSPTDRVDDVQFSPEELRAIVEETRRHHSYVTAHCTGAEGAYQAILAGVECVEHGVMLTQREVELMAEKDIPLVSTLWIALHVAELPGLAPHAREKARRCAESALQTVELCRKYGVRIALGTDFSNSPNTPYLKNGREFEALVDAGLTPMEAIRSGTSIAASVLRLENTGRLTAGYQADMVVADADPLKSISCLADASHICLVVRHGRICKSAPAPHD